MQPKRARGNARAQLGYLVLGYHRTPRRLSLSPSLSLVYAQVGPEQRLVPAIPLGGPAPASAPRRTHMSVRPRLRGDAAFPGPDLRCLLTAALILALLPESGPARNEYTSPLSPVSRRPVCCSRIRGSQMRSYSRRTRPIKPCLIIRFCT
ncbi:hypothetical protein GGS23DRAFT_411779 [Durotheca rogersii]|uniref:uncharacterized protein n=1 Tax=Durotheca rogersii TaxID=419775 RepID=UPI0022202D07|nr:uncharacterized protein GGS23DRAFT_411779 [Durotheca rogersii]KAI5865153.1 hypothetical protein GGS23DRAFT_411779 [Durotheca rogersii]